MGISLFFYKKLGFHVIRETDSLCVILKKCHRFRSADRGGLYALAKDLARITADHAGGHWFESSSLHHEPP